MASLITRNGTFYLQWRVGGKIRRRSLDTTVKQIAKEKLRQFESAQARGIDDMLPTQTPIADVVTAYVEHIRHVKTPKSAQTDIYYLREAFGPICEALQITSRRVTEATRKRPRKPGEDRRRRQPGIASAGSQSRASTTRTAGGAMSRRVSISSRTGSAASRLMRRRSWGTGGIDGFTRSKVAGSVGIQSRIRAWLSWQVRRITIENWGVT